MVYAMLKKVGAGLVGREVSKRLVLAALNKVSLRLATKQVLKYLPVAGQAGGRGPERHRNDLSGQLARRCLL
jgi:hypothetical protein